MQYSFDIEDAEKYGVNEAIMLSNIKFWLRKNLANDVNIHDDNVWTYNSKRAFSKLFKFWTEKQVKRILSSLVEQGVLVTGNYNKSAYDRTLWYALKHPELLQITHETIGTTDWTKRANQLDQKGQPIPDSKTHIENNNVLFEAFWHNYPRKSDKKKASVAFNNLSQTKQVKAVEDCASRYEDTDKKFIPLPTTYIHGERWDDEPLESKTKDPYGGLV